METQGQIGTPNALLNAKGSTGRFARPRRWLVPVIFAIALFAMFLAAPRMARAQHWPRLAQPNPGGPPQSNFPNNPQAFDPDVGASAPNMPMNRSLGTLTLMPVDNSRLINAESCQTWTAFAVDSPTVSVVRLEVPSKASHEFQKACGYFKDHRLKPAEEHAREAVKIYPQYAAAWVVLGQILHAGHEDSKALDACRKADSADPNYAPPYICLAEFAAEANNWDDAYSLANHALSLDPATDPYAFLWAAEADFHLKRMDQAELYGLSAEKLDPWNRLAEVHLLLAQIYDAKGNRGEEERELRKFVKTSPHDTDWLAARTTLAKFQDNVAAK